MFRKKIEQSEKDIIFQELTWVSEHRDKRAKGKDFIEKKLTLLKWINAVRVQDICAEYAERGKDKQIGKHARQQDDAKFINCQINWSLMDDYVWESFEELQWDRNLENGWRGSCRCVKGERKLSKRRIGTKDKWEMNRFCFLVYFYI